VLIYALHPLSAIATIWAQYGVYVPIRGISSTRTVHDLAANFLDRSLARGNAPTDFG